MLPSKLGRFQGFVTLLYKSTLQKPRNRLFDLMAPTPFFCLLYYFYNYIMSTQQVEKTPMGEQQFELVNP